MQPRSDGRQYAKWSDLAGYLYTPDGVQAWLEHTIGILRANRKSYEALVSKGLDAEHMSDGKAMLRAPVVEAFGVVTLRCLLDMPRTITMWDTDILIASAAGCESFRDEPVNLVNQLACPGIKPGLNVWVTNLNTPVTSGMSIEGNIVNFEGGGEMYRMADIYIMPHLDYPAVDYVVTEGVMFVAQIFKSTTHRLPILRAGPVTQPPPGSEHPTRVGSFPGFERIVARCQFLNQPFISTATASLPKQVEKEYQRRKSKPPSVNVVSLRRIEHKATTEAEQHSVEWSCQWLVGGHWRRQYFPREKSHHAVYVRPYVKGPKGLPLKAPKQTVYVAKR